MPSKILFTASMQQHKEGQRDINQLEQIEKLTAVGRNLAKQFESETKEFRLQSHNS